jgi:uncharacterized protein (DUF58 family)
MLFDRQQRTLSPESAAATANGLTYLDQAAMTRLRLAATRLKLHSSKIRALQNGQYLSSFRGRGMEFDESRAYQAGDDIRNMDWKVMARTGTAHTKLFREERERPVLLWVDCRETMCFATRGVFKSVIACKAAATLAWASNQQGDKLGGLIFSDQQHAELRPRRGKSGVLNFIRQLETAQSVKHNQSFSVNTDVALARLHRVTRPGSLIFLISDFRGLDEKAKSHLSQLSRHNDVVMFFIYDELEKTLPPDGQYLARYGNQNLLFESNLQRRSEYQLQFEQRMSSLRSLAHQHRINFITCRTDDDPLQVLKTYFR